MRPRIRLIGITVAGSRACTISVALNHFALYSRMSLHPSLFSMATETTYAIRLALLVVRGQRSIWGQRKELECRADVTGEEGIPPF